MTFYCAFITASQLQAVASSLALLFSFSRTAWSLSDAQQPVACPLLLRHDNTGVGAGVLWIVNHPIRLVVVSVVEELKESERKDRGGIK
jgi:hypothetical protein